MNRFYYNSYIGIFIVALVASTATLIILRVAHDVDSGSYRVVDSPQLLDRLQARTNAELNQSK